MGKIYEKSLFLTHYGLTPFFTMKKCVEKLFCLKAISEWRLDPFILKNLQYWNHSRFICLNFNPISCHFFSKYTLAFGSGKLKTWAKIVSWNKTFYVPLRKWTWFENLLKGFTSSWSNCSFFSLLFPILACVNIPHTPYFSQLLQDILSELGRFFLLFY